MRTYVLSMFQLYPTLFTNYFVFLSIIFTLQGFDEYMNLVLDDAVEIQQKRDTSQKLGRILLKGDTITMLTAAPR